MDVDVYGMGDNLHMHDLKHDQFGERRSGEDRRSGRQQVIKDRRQGDRRQSDDTEGGES